MKAFRFRTSSLAHLQRFGLALPELLRRSGLPWAGSSTGLALNTSQWFALWRTMASMGVDPATALGLAASEFHAPQPLGLVLAHARTLGDALARIQRYHHACTPGLMAVENHKGECSVSFAWPQAQEAVPLLLLDAMLAAMAELGRRGAGRAWAAARVELRRRSAHGDCHAAYFQGPVQFGAARDALVFRSDQMGLPFRPGGAQPASAPPAAWREGESSAAEQVRQALPPLLSGSRPDIAQVAQALGISTRTLQRRITDEGQTFRQLLMQTRQTLARAHLAQRSLGLDEVAFLLGFEDGTSFFRAFKRWEGQTPGAWRAGLPPAASQQG
jgi:AraC-like DNA-binding protein